MNENSTTNHSEQHQAPRLRVGAVSKRFLNKLFFRAGQEDEGCYRLSFHIETLKEEELPEMKLYEAVKDNSTGYFFCKFFDECGEKGECGKQCSEYSPKNGKSGVCKHYGNVYDSGQEYLLLP